MVILPKVSITHTHTHTQTEKHTFTFIYLFIYLSGVSGKSFPLRENFSQVELHIYTEIPMNVNGFNSSKKMLSSFGSTHCLYTIMCYHTLLMSVLKQTAKRSHQMVRVICKVLGNLKTIFMKIVRFFQN